MDRHASTIKRFRQSLKRNERNRAVRTKVKTLISKVYKAENLEDAAAALRDAGKGLDKAAGKNVLHAKKAARLKSRLSSLVATKFSG